jgi:hypothetical protein
MQSLMEIVGSDEQLACVGFAVTPEEGDCSIQVRRKERLRDEGNGAVYPSANDGG